MNPRGLILEPSLCTILLAGSSNCKLLLTIELTQRIYTSSHLEWTITSLRWENIEQFINVLFNINTI